MAKNEREKVTKEAPEFSRRRSVQDDYLDAQGREMPDPRPIQPPLGYKKVPSMADTIRAMVRSERLRIAALEAEAETFEEADDFDVADDLDPTSPWEEQFEPGVPLTPTMAEQAEAFAEAMFNRFNPPEPSTPAEGGTAPPSAAPVSPGAPSNPVPASVVPPTPTPEQRGFFKR